MKFARILLITFLLLRFDVCLADGETMPNFSGWSLAQLESAAASDKKPWFHCPTDAKGKVTYCEFKRDWKNEFDRVLALKKAESTKPAEPVREAATRPAPIPEPTPLPAPASSPGSSLFPGSSPAPGGLFGSSPPVAERRENPATHFPPAIAHGVGPSRKAERRTAPDSTSVTEGLRAAAKADREGQTTAFLNASLKLAKKVPISIIRQMGNPNDAVVHYFGLNSVQLSHLKEIAELSGLSTEKLREKILGANDALETKEARLALADRVENQPFLGATTVGKTLGRLLAIDRTLAEQKIMAGSDGLAQLAKSQVDFFGSLRDHADSLELVERQLRDRLAHTSLSRLERKHLQLMLVGAVRTGGKIISPTDPSLVGLDRGEAQNFSQQFDKTMAASTDQGKLWNKQIGEGVRTDASGNFSITSSAAEATDLRKKFSPTAVASYAAFLYGKSDPRLKELAEKIWHLYIGPKFTLMPDKLSSGDNVALGTGPGAATLDSRGAKFQVNGNLHDYGIVLAALQEQGTRISVETTAYDSKAEVSTLPTYSVSGDNFLKN